MKYVIGGEPSFSFTQGFVVTPADLTERGMSVLLSVIESSTTPATRPKLITVTANGLKGRPHSLLPLPIKAVFSLIKVPHDDKINQEKIVKGAAGWDGEVNGWLGANNVVIVRPAVLTSGECKADKESDAYRTGQELRSAWTVSRADVAHFITDKVTVNWDEWAGQAWSVSY